MPIEDCTTYTEVDGSVGLTVTAPKVDANVSSAVADDYVYKDYTADYFNALNVFFEGYMNSTNSTTWGMGAMGLTVTAVNDRTGWGTSDVSLALWKNDTGQVYTELCRGNEVAVATNYSGLALNTLYYFKLTRVAGSDTINLYVYSDSARTSPVFSLTLAGFGTATKYRYSYGFVNKNSGVGGRNFQGYIQNLDFTQSSIKTITGLAKASVKTINGLAIASVKTWDGLA